MSHSLASPIPWGKNSKAYFAHRPADRLIVFIHGFGGKALKTWKGMERLLDHPNAAGSDVVFYGYRSLTAPALNSATCSEASSTLPSRKRGRGAGRSPKLAPTPKSETTGKC